MRTNAINKLNFESVYTAGNYSGEQKQIADKIKSELFSDKYKDKKGRTLVDAVKEKRDQDILILTAPQNKVAVDIVLDTQPLENGKVRINKTYRLGTYGLQDCENAAKDLKSEDKRSSYVSKAFAALMLIVASVVCGGLVTKCKEVKNQSAKTTILTSKAAFDTNKMIKTFKI